MVDAKDDALLGRLAVHFKLLPQEQLGEVHAQLGRLQEPAPIGPTMVAMELISQDQLAALLKAQTQYLENQREKAGHEPSSPAVDSTPTQQNRASEPTTDAENASPNGAGATAGTNGAAADGDTDA
jgi:hypothetical protein